MARHHITRDDDLPGVEAYITVDDPDGKARITAMGLNVLNGGEIMREHLPLLFGGLPGGMDDLLRAIPATAHVDLTSTEEPSNRAHTQPDGDGEEDETDESGDDDESPTPVSEWGPGAGKKYLVQRANGITPDADVFAAAYRHFNGNSQAIARYFGVDDTTKIHSWTFSARKKGALPAADSMPGTVRRGRPPTRT